MKDDILQERLIQLTRDLVLVESTDDRPEERSRCFQQVRNHLEEVPGLQIRMYENGGYESLVALPDGAECPDVLLCGHLDVVHHPEPDSYRSEVREGRIYGPGAGDMKGQLAIMIELIRYLSRECPGCSVGIAITSDEERGGEHGVRYLVEEVGLRCGIAIIPDGGSLHEVIVEEKGIIHLQLEAVGVSAHAARPWLAVNALERLTGAIGRIKTYFENERPIQVVADDPMTHWFSTCTETMIGTTNDSPNRVPDSASAVLDIRYVPPVKCSDLLGELENLLGEGVALAPIVTAESTHLQPDEAFVKMTSEVTGKDACLVRSSGGSDGRFFAAQGIPVLISRPYVGDLHGRDEWIDIDSMVAYFHVCCRYILSRGDALS